MINQVPLIQHTNTNNFFLLAGPCVVEGEEITLSIAETLKKITSELKIPFIFKASYRKANRSRLDSFTGIGDQEALSILEKVRKEIGVPIVTDIHESSEAIEAAQVVDVLQIPAFLCRQTDLLIASGKTGKHVNIKKGQFLSADAMQFAVDKIKSTSNNNVWLTERGSMFGYHDLIVDYRNIIAFKNMNVPAIMDVTHALQQPNQSSGVTGGQPQLIATIAKAAIAVGADGLFIETHPNPSKALSDGANMLPLENIKSLMIQLLKIKEAIS
ncbi:MAG: hypothetical protein RIQ89_1593 [Bacteroidota bacterium]|jgi:2-dehydro-3-deoxyphosphooctonate aldolase (KDO 8-P synthase)